MQAEAERTLEDERARGSAATAALEARLSAAGAAARDMRLSLEAEAASRAAAEVLVANLKAQVTQLQARKGVGMRAQVNCNPLDCAGGCKVLRKSHNPRAVPGISGQNVGNQGLRLWMTSTACYGHTAYVLSPSAVLYTSCYACCPSC